MSSISPPNLYTKKQSLHLPHRQSPKRIREIFHSSLIDVKGRLNLTPCLLHFQFTISYLPFVKNGRIDHISSYPYQPAENICAYDEDFTVAFLSNNVSAANTLHNHLPVSTAHLNCFCNNDLCTQRITTTTLTTNNFIDFNIFCT